MFDGTSFGNTLNILQKSMDVSVLRREVIANNIANSETPNFKRTEVNFESALSRAIESQKQTYPEMKVADSRHIPSGRAASLDSVQPTLQLDYLSEVKANGNNVDIEEEATLATQNQMMYELYTLSVNHFFSQIDMVVK